MKDEAAAESKIRTFKSRPDRGASSNSRVRVEGAKLAVLLSRPRLVVEIGCGVGLHPIQYAQQNPTKNIIAIERTREKFQKFERRLKAHPHLHDRICAVHADAIHFMDQSIEDQSLDEVWILYPNPETAKPSRRWFQTPFMRRLVKLMKSGGTLYFATNIEDYAHTAAEIAPTLGFKVVKRQEVQKSNPEEFIPRTHFEKKYFDRGETLFNFEFKLQRREV